MHRQASVGRKCKGKVRHVEVSLAHYLQMPLWHALKQQRSRAHGVIITSNQVDGK